MASLFLMLPMIAAFALYAILLAVILSGVALPIAAMAIWRNEKGRWFALLGLVPGAVGGVALLALFGVVLLDLY